MNAYLNADVHYVSYGTPGGEYPSVCRAAKVTEVDPMVPSHVGLFVMNPTGVFFHPLAGGGCHHHQGDHSDPQNPVYPGGTWHYSGATCSR